MKYYFNNSYVGYSINNMLSNLCKRSFFSLCVCGKTNMENSHFSQKRINYNAKIEAAALISVPYILLLLDGQGAIYKVAFYINCSTLETFSIKSQFLSSFIWIVENEVSVILEVFSRVKIL